MNCVTPDPDLHFRSHCLLIVIIASLKSTMDQWILGSDSKTIRKKQSHETRNV